jgi:hypothetical protein
VDVESRGSFDLKTFCTWAGISRSLAYEEIKIGRLRLTKCGRKSLITLEDARAWLASLPKTESEWPRTIPAEAAGRLSTEPIEEPQTARRQHGGVASYSLGAPRGPPQSRRPRSGC